MDEHRASAQCSPFIVADLLRRYRRAIPPAPKSGLWTRVNTSLSGRCSNVGKTIRWMEGDAYGMLQCVGKERIEVRPYDLRMERVDQCCNHTYVYCMYIIANTLTYAVTFLS
ncbi:hypothetical protein FIBSPDRAFT_851450 [Athelia psychrophila]|uniref:Uncharacterized protein n=1 Tax=Athelia psychrophila TaxID=1759441 RepID=A0A166SH74_9AGAM|nr:hypothetical protein FIBSPDRAFT_851450 [Fibularhizoctonia sp. CBS 109695]